ncbi:PSD1 and planctomycete cytochrome C domain-containing protein [Fimbriiglobus ruber]|uniref:Cytochrome c domain-containing protein n=1 Tax=Fimbriiglobus ruber TaxID=1908690 RepID=A0A225DMG0_9BACT|nr:PSD1 and planctomycete cytochrome C domain-containing protein [Fimbriiglobus ruber]OWK39738.1 protein of unknown function DUF1549 [Fimbriiglobus ruber]
MNASRLLIVSLAFAAAAPAWAAEPVAIDFNRQIRPLLSDNCFACHGPDEKTRKAKLRLDTKDGLFAKTDDGKVIVPGLAGQSELFARVSSADADTVMPPPKFGKKLTPDQIKLLKTWIDQGANWSAHWAFGPLPRDVVVPAVSTPGAIVRNPIDAFVLARLAKEGLKAAPEASKETLIRRVSLDLIGLPPTPEEVAAFVKDASPNAYEKVVDRLLASPHYGERLAMSWLDGARYADSNGYQADYERYMWPWRDWVIRAYNENKPFDQFTIEQLAGDMLPNATPDQKLATGFNRNHRINTEGGIIAEEWRIETVIDRVETTSAVWLGLTAGCARCHDHKYDPLSQKEFYQLFAFFNNVPESGVGAEAPVNHPPLLRTPRPGDEQKLKDMEATVAKAADEVKAQEAKLSDLVAAWAKDAAGEKPAIMWATVKPTKAVSAGNAKLTTRPDQSVFASGPNPATDEYTVTFTANLKTVTAVRVEALPDDKLPAKGPGRYPSGNVVLTDVKVQVDGVDAKLASASADFSQDNYPVSAAIDPDPATGWAIHPRVGEPHDAVFSLATPAKSDKPMTVTVTLAFHSQFPQHAFGRFRLAVTDADNPHSRGGPPAPVLAALNVPADKRTPQQTKALNDYVRANHAKELTRADSALAAAKKIRDDFEKSLPTAMVMAEMPTPRDAYLLVRGQYDKKGEKVSAGLPAMLPPMPKDAPQNRLGFARWLTRPEHPLTARVAVNRFWEKFFGTGLVKTGENFGLQGDAPSHPELLDWLAAEFAYKGWDMKAIQKTIVLSATYRQASAVTPALIERDPENRLHARGPRFRLPAELVRDNALAVAGLLVDKVGGPSVRPYQPQGVWDETNFYGNLRNYKPDTGDGLYRRSMYTIWKRTAAPPTMLLFDSPSREVCTVKRGRTNTPLQALALLNEVTFVEAARALGEQAMAAGDTPDARLTYAFRRATSRAPTVDELKVLRAGFDRRLAAFRKTPDAAKKLLAVGTHKSDAKLDAAELAAYTMAASVILNLDETVTKE